MLEIRTPRSMSGDGKRHSPPRPSSTLPGPRQHGHPARCGGVVDADLSSGLLGRVSHDDIRHIEPAPARILLGKCDRTKRRRILLQSVGRNGAGNPHLRCSRCGCHSKSNLDGERLIAWECAARGVEAAILDLVVVCEEQGQE